MKEVTLKIPNNKWSFFMELVNQLGFEISQEKEIPEEHKNIVRERIRSATPENMISWKDARKQLTFKTK